MRDIATVKRERGRWPGIRGSERLAPYLAVALTFVFTGITNAIDIEEVTWGLDGRVRPYRFNPVSVLVSNTTEEPVAFELSLSRLLGNGSDRVGAQIVEAVFLSPYSSRWVQFYPYVANPFDQWRVSWGILPSQRFDLPTPQLGTRGRIALIDPTQIRSSTPSAKTLPDNLFPPFVSATENIEAIFLDYVPRWQENQRQALLDWVYRGGQLYLSPGSDKLHPEFTSQLAPLNSPLKEHQYGLGQVFRTPSRSAAIDLATQNLGPPIRASGDGSDEDPDAAEASDAEASDEDEKKLATDSSLFEEWDLAQQLLSPLKLLTQPRHNWFVIHTLSIIYLGLVFPGWYFLSRRPTDYRTTILALLGLALLLTVTFNMVGRRGYGEATTVNAVALARPVGPKDYDVSIWSNIFVTEGARYELQHGGVGSMFSTGNAFEQIPGLIDNGLEGSFKVDIPLFSSQTYLHRGKLTGPALDFSVKNFRSAKPNEIDELRIQCDQGLPNFTEMFLLYGRTFFSIGQNEEGELYTRGKSQQLLDSAYFDRRNSRQISPFEPRQAPPADNVFWELKNLLVARDLGIGRDADLDNFSLPGGQARLYLFGELPTEFSLKSDVLGKQRGRVLYAFNIRLPISSVENVSDPQSDSTSTDMDGAAPDSADEGQDDAAEPAADGGPEEEARRQNEQTDEQTDEQHPQAETEHDETDDAN